MPSETRVRPAGSPTRVTDVRIFAAAVALSVVFGLGVLTGLPVLRVPAGLLLTYVGPGAFLVRLLRPAGRWWYAVTLAAALSTASALVAVLLLEAVGARATPTTVGWLFAVLTPVLAAADLARRVLTPGRPGDVPARPSRRTLLTATAVGVCSLVLAVTALTISIAGERTSSTVAFTQVGLVPDPSAARAFTLSITNREGTATTYRLRVSSPGAAVAERTVTVPNGAVHSEVLRVTATGTLDVLVYGGAPTDAGYRRVRAEIL
jgi:hypothetical protein